ncbi:alpha/beta hydrolase [Pedobacter metabolipauper]|uniref:Alpha-beta hydrolase superfamily lysophospholipase n=1 Tax=Pedobacter metabolipauper TaxID=425513 RepID=A0A4R6T415_9SPHI|nr:alpha/beta hydrolase [Pedobacter metabolipauper]TDQ12121.1 alpha-beta hydrolase superfamily lysophospholipase [Pedobacter metabolipauper]
MKNLTPKTIVFITGAFVSSNSWDEWQLFFQEKGFETAAPAWPFKGSSANQLRLKHPDQDIASIRLQSLVDHYTDYIAKLPEKPILIGHSMGGLLVQLLIQKELAFAGIAIHSLQPQGVFTFKFSFYKAGWGPLGFFTSAKKTYLMSFREWQYAFTNCMPYEAQKEAYYKLLVPESKLVVRDAITDVARVDFKKPHAPLLFISGSIDRFIPASLNYSNYKKYSHSGSTTDYKEFEGRNHFVLGQPTWKENAGYIANWIANL